MSECAEARMSFADRLPLTQAAIEFAHERHTGQHRASDDAPFVLHPIEVASMLERSHYPDHVVAAAVLHDVLEDTDAERSELEERFGPDVADLVAIVSDDPAIPELEDRKDEVRERVQEAGGYAAAVYAADKVAKVRELRMMLARGVRGEETDVKRQRSLKSLAMLEATMPGSRLVEQLRFELETLETLPPETGAY